MSCEIACEELYKNDEKLKREDVLTLQDWVNKQPHLPDITELEAILFLHSCYYSNEQAKSTLDTYYTIKTLCPEIFANKFTNNDAFKKGFDVTLTAPLPQLTKEGYLVLYMRLMDMQPDHYNFATHIRNFELATNLYLHQKGAHNGVIIVGDVSGVVFGHLTKVSPITLKKFLYYLQEAMPIRLKGIHFVNPVAVMDKILALIRPFLKKEMIEMLYVHKDMSDLYKFVPKECLPQEMGGNGGSLGQLHAQSKKNVLDNGEFFARQNKMVVEESRRPGKPKNAGDFFGIEGTFKQLQVD